jgi:hypothetical protein
MSATQASRQAEIEGVTMLSRWMERLFRQLARLLVGRMTLIQAQNLLREVFVQECEARLQSKRPGKNIALSQLALLTGLDTRTLSRIRGDLALRRLAREKETRIGELSPEAKVVEMWAHNPEYTDPESGTPRVLGCGGSGSEFEELVRQVVTARGVTVSSVMERLLATESVRFDSEAGELHLATKRYSPFISEDEVGLMNSGLQALTNLSGSIVHNVNASRDQRLIQRELWTYRLDPLRRPEFRETLRNFLLEVEERGEVVISPLESEFESGDQLTAGLGFYYFEETEPTLNEGTMRAAARP